MMEIDISAVGVTNVVRLTQVLMEFTFIYGGENGKLVKMNIFV